MSRVVVAATLVFAIASQTQANAAPIRTGHEEAAGERACTADGLIHAEVSPTIAQQVTNSIRLLEPGARVREIAKLTMPCGFHLDPRYGWNLVLTNGTEVRRYTENNAFGFAPAFGFSDQATKSYTLNYRLAADGELHADSCGERLKGVKGGPQLCSSFGSQSSFFGTMPNKRSTRLAHFVWHGSVVEEDFPVADLGGRVESIFFLPPPDAPGGTITLILSGRRGTYRAYLDTPKG
ncbi:MAG: hypothetical protein ACJ8FS_03130 [Sphingomicrobium sp.]